MEILATQLADLFSAVQQSDEKQIRRLLAVNVSPNQRNPQGITALMVATKIGNSKIIKMLHGAIRDKRPSAQLFFSQIVSTFSTAVSPTPALTSFIAADLTTSHTTPHVISRTFARSNEVTPLSMLPVLPNELSSVNDTPTLIVEDRQPFYQEDASAAVVSGVADLLEIGLIDSVKTESLETQSPTGQFLEDQTAADQTELLKAAILNNDLDAVEALLSAGASVQSANWYDTPLLVVAAENANSNIVQALLQAGASVNRGYDRLPLNVASERGNFEIVHMLMCAGADLEATEESGYTALMCAAAAGHLRIVQTLVACGANVNANYYGKTPLMLTTINGHTKVYDFLYPYSQPQNLADQNTRLQQQAIAAQPSQLDREIFALFEQDVSRRADRVSPGFRRGNAVNQE